MKFIRNIFKFGSRIILVIALNILIVLVASVVATAICSYFGIESSRITFYVILYSLIGFGGAFFSLYLSVFLAKKAHGVRILEKTSASHEERKIINMVETFARKAGISKPPEVGIYNSPEVNAFATGPSKNKSLVAVSSGLLEHMDDEEVEGVIAHEVTHVANGDMVTMTLLMGLVNTMVLIFARLAASAIMANSRRNSFFMEYMMFVTFQVALNLLGSILILSPFSRRREYKADKGGAFLAGKSKMIKALRKLQSIYVPSVNNPNVAKYNAFKISTGNKNPSLMLRLLSTHPPLTSRIRKLERMHITSSMFF